MKEDRQFTLTSVGAAESRNWPLKQLPKSAPWYDANHVSSTEEIQTRTSNIVMLFLELAKATGDAAYLDVAKAGSTHLVKVWTGLSARRPLSRSPDKLCSARSLSGVALALAETWKATGDPLYRHAGLNIIQYLANAVPATSRQ